MHVITSCQVLAIPVMYCRDLLGLDVDRLIQKVVEQCNKLGISHHFPGFVMPKKTSEKFYGDYLDAASLETVKASLLAAVDTPTNIIGDRDGPMWQGETVGLASPVCCFILAVIWW